jgi:hypothetical protein
MPEFSQALRDCYNYLDRSSPILGTIELYCALWPAPFRFVADYRDLLATLEHNAPNDASQQVTFSKASFSVDRPSIDDSGQAELTIHVDGVSGTVMRAIDDIDLDGNPVGIVYREFVHPEPENEALVLPGPDLIERQTAVSVACTLTRVEIKAVYVDHANRRFPRRNFNRRLFKGMAK